MVRVFIQPSAYSSVGWEGVRKRLVMWALSSLYARPAVHSWPAVSPRQCVQSILNARKAVIDGCHAVSPLHLFCVAVGGRPPSSSPHGEEEVWRELVYGCMHSESRREDAKEHAEEDGMEMSLPPVPLVILRLEVVISQVRHINFIHL